MNKETDEAKRNNKSGGAVLRHRLSRCRLYLCALMRKGYAVSELPRNASGYETIAI